MRKAFINTLTDLAATDESIWLLTADMGYGLVEPFANAHPDRFINVGVAEQNMVGIATGLALSGKMVFCYSIANFPTLRCLEQIRNDVCYHNASVCIVAGNTGLTYGALGSTHHATEDIAIMRSLPNMTVIAPCDRAKTATTTKAIAEMRSPCYLRLSRTDKELTYLSGFRIGKAATVVGGKDVTLIAMGWMLQIALWAAEVLVRRGVSTRVLDIHTIKPLDSMAIIRAAMDTKAIITIEEHSLLGGLGSAVAEALAGMRVHAALTMMGLSDNFQTKALSHDEMLAANHLTVDGIIMEVLDAIA